MRLFCITTLFFYLTSAFAQVSTPTTTPGSTTFDQRAPNTGIGTGTMGITNPASPTTGVRSIGTGTGGITNSTDSALSNEALNPGSIRVINRVNSTTSGTSGISTPTMNSNPVEVSCITLGGIILTNTDAGYEECTRTTR